MNGFGWSRGNVDRGSHEDASADVVGRVEDELRRAANKCDTRVARDCGTNLFLVKQVRERLGAYPTGPV